MPKLGAVYVLRQAAGLHAHDAADRGQGYFEAGIFIISSAVLLGTNYIIFYFYSRYTVVVQSRVFVRGQLDLHEPPRHRGRIQCPTPVTTVNNNTSSRTKIEALVSG